MLDVDCTTVQTSHPCSDSIGRDRTPFRLAKHPLELLVVLAALIVALAFLYTILIRAASFSQSAGESAKTSARSGN